MKAIFCLKFSKILVCYVTRKDGKLYYKKFVFFTVQKVFFTEEIFSISINVLTNLKHAA
jgi:hypothetical protein